MKTILLKLTNAPFILNVAFGWHHSQLTNFKSKAPPCLCAANSLVRSSSTTEPAYNHDTLFRTGDTLPKMIPLSNPPLLLLQSCSAIISRKECKLLSQYFEQQEPSLNNFNHPILDKDQINQAKDILSRVRRVIDKLTNCPSHSDEMQVPRYIRYEAKLTSLGIFQSPDFVNVLLPDGLHVDTNNGKLFRHVTAILYLTDNQDGFADEHNSIVAGGGTSFPLAVPFGHERDSIWDNSANNLLTRGIHHTKADTGDQSLESDERLLERMSLDIFYRDFEHSVRMSGISREQKMSEHGIRVMPNAGKLIYFHNVGDDGTPDPTSFHGGEELAVLSSQPELELSSALQHKSILVFFKEIPVEKIKDFDTFTLEVQKAREWTVKEYYS